jgi:hypothetical protein
MTQRRKATRHFVTIKAIIVDTAGKLVGECVMVDVSASGARLSQLGSTEVPDKFDLVLTRNGTVRRKCEVVRRSEQDLGIRFFPTKSVQSQTRTTKPMPEPNPHPQ